MPQKTVVMQHREGWCNENLRKVDNHSSSFLLSLTTANMYDNVYLFFFQILLKFRINLIFFFTKVNNS